MSEIPMPESVTLPIETVRTIVGAGERAIAALPVGSAEATDLDDALGALAAAVLRAMGFDDGEL